MSIFKIVLWVVVVLFTALVLIEAIRLLMLKHDVVAYKKYWNNLSQQTPAPDSILYVALGDSAAQGIGASKPAKGYAGLLSEQIAKTSGRPVHVINLSTTGAKINDVLADQLPWLQQMQLPAESIITVEIGANDLGSFEPDKFAIQIDELFRQLPPQTVVSDMPYFGDGWARSRETSAVKASAIIDGLAAKYRLRLAPLHQTTKHKSSPWLNSADFFHPNDKGYAKWYQAFESALKQ